jgi:hypothetical protein
MALLSNLTVALMGDMETLLHSGRVWDPKAWTCSLRRKITLEQSLLDEDHLIVSQRVATERTPQAGATGFHFREQLSMADEHGHKSDY